MEKMICFDMDGTIADLYGVDNWLRDLKNEDARPYKIAKPMCDMAALRETLLKLKEQGWEIRVISWLAKDSTERYKDAVRQAKIDWLAYHDFPMDACHLVAYGTTKADCVRRYLEDNSNFILIDDNEKIRNGWHLGDAIDPTAHNIITTLTGLLV